MPKIAAKYVTPRPARNIHVEPETSITVLNSENPAIQKNQLAAPFKTCCSPAFCAACVADNGSPNCGDCGCVCGCGCCCGESPKPLIRPPGFWGWADASTRQARLPDLVLRS